MKTNNLLLSAVASLFAVAACQQSADIPAYLDSSKPIEERVEDALSRMTTEEKVAMTHAQSKFSSTGVPRLGIPDVWCTDGPHGIRTDVLWDEWVQAGCTNDSCTAFPALSALAATWNEDLSLLYGQSIGEEAAFRGKTVLLGPGVNINRSPLNGRSFEYMGEDPYLASRMVVPYVKGVQSNGVAACVKHYALNNQEINRFTTNVHVDDRTLYEIYLPAFKAAVEEGQAWAIMGSYNLYEGEWNCHNKRLLCDILKGEWGFDGVVISDWGGCHITEQAVKNGLDMEYGSWTNGLTMGRTDAYNQYYLADNYLKGLADGTYGEEELNDKARRILRLEYRTNLSDERSRFARFTCPDHYAAARRIGAESLVLLKNEGVLPIDLNTVKNVLVVGENAVKMMTVGGGSSSLKVKHEISPLKGITDRLAGIANVTYERGYIGSLDNTYNGVKTGQDLAETRDAAQLIADAVAAAEKADYVIFVGGLNKSHTQDSEGADRLQYNLPYGQEAVILALAEANPNLVVVNISGNAVAMPWASEVPAVIQSWYLGSEAGNSLADVLVGDVNPSGKLPMTIASRYEDGPIKTVEQYPGVDEGTRLSFDGRDNVVVLDETYSEGIYVGYRWFQKNAIAVTYPFGHGLSYTTFSYGDAKANKTVLKLANREISADTNTARKSGNSSTKPSNKAQQSGNSSAKSGNCVKVSVPVTNSGKVAGAEIVQLYISDPECSVDKPVRELKGFKKVFLQPGETATVEFTIDQSALSYFDADKHAWVAEPGDYVIEIGASSEDIRTSATIALR